MDIRGRSALITGGASGLGGATAEALHAAGGVVTLLDLPGSEGAARAAALGDRAAFVAADVRDEAAVADAVATAVDRSGALHIVVNCAGIGPPQRVVGRDGPHDLELFRTVIEINLVGTFNVLRLAAAQMASQEPVEGDERGVIVNTASIAAFEGQIGQAAYSASKGGIVALTLTVARDLARHGIRVNTVAPGLMDTPLLAGLPDDARLALAANIPHPPRLGDPAEFGALVHHIVTNPYLNGETIRLDGALRMQPR